MMQSSKINFTSVKTYFYKPKAFTTFQFVSAFTILYTSSAPYILHATFIAVAKAKLSFKVLFTVIMYVFRKAHSSFPR